MSPRVHILLQTAEDMPTWFRFTLLVVCLCLGLQVQSSADPIRSKWASQRKSGEATTVVCLGDSVTGVYYHTGGLRAYPEMLEIALRRALPDVTIQVVNAGISGNTTVDALARLEKDVLAHRPSMVTVMFGLNDSGRLPLADYRKNLTEIARRCRESGAEVMFCTPNGILENAASPNAKFHEFCTEMISTAADLGIPLCDIETGYRAVRLYSPTDWRFLFSDAIHPNMDGHRFNAQMLVHELTGKEVSLNDVVPLPALQKAATQKKQGITLRVLATSPIDRDLRAAFSQLKSPVAVEVITWDVADKSLAEIEESAKAVRQTKGLDLVVVAVPANVTPGKNATSEEISRFSWILNHSLAFGRQEWDVVVVAPSVQKQPLSEAASGREEFTRRMVRAQDLNLIMRKEQEATSTVEEILLRWLTEQPGFGSP